MKQLNLSLLFFSFAAMLALPSCGKQSSVVNGQNGASLASFTVNPPDDQEITLATMIATPVGDMNGGALAADDTRVEVKAENVTCAPDAVSGALTCTDGTLTIAYGYWKFSASFANDSETLYDSEVCNEANGVEYVAATNFTANLKLCEPGNITTQVTVAVGPSAASGDNRANVDINASTVAKEDNGATYLADIAVVRGTSNAGAPDDNQKCITAFLITMKDGYTIKQSSVLPSNMMLHKYDANGNKIGGMYGDFSLQTENGKLKVTNAANPVDGFCDVEYNGFMVHGNSGLVFLDANGAEVEQEANQVFLFSYEVEPEPAL